MPDEGPATASGADATERSPLLGKAGPSDHGAIATTADEAPDNNEQEDQGNTPLVAEPSLARLLLILVPTYFGLFFAALDSTIVATLAAPISSSFESGELISWLASAYLIANAAIQPLSGKLTDIFGRRIGLVLANLFFAVGTLICGLAKNDGIMIFGRIVAGIGGGCINTIGTFIASDLVPLRKRGLWQGIGNVVYGTGSGLGGIFGGWISDQLSWRWAFLVQVPFLVVAGIIVMFTVNIPVKETDTSRWKRVDFLGAFTLMISLVLLLLGLNSGGNIVPWNHPLVYVTIPLSLVFLGAFVYVEANVASEPMIPVRLMLNRTVAAACLTNWFIPMARFSMIYYGPIYFLVRGSSATAAGARLIPEAVGISIGSVFCGMMMRWTGRYYILNVFVEMMIVLAAILMVFFMKLNSPDWPAYLLFFFMGFGNGGMLTITLLALISAVDREHHAVITSASYAFRSTGSTIGIAISSAVFQNVLKTQLWKRFGDRKDAAKIIKKIRGSIDYAKHLPEDWRLGTLYTYMEALQGVWITVLILAVLGASTSLLMREHTLHSNLARK